MMVIVEKNPREFKKFSSVKEAKKRGYISDNAYWYIYTEKGVRIKIYPYGRKIMQQTINFK